MSNLNSDVKVVRNSNKDIFKYIKEMVINIKDAFKIRYLRSIRSRILISYLVMTILMITIFEIFLFIGVKNYYYTNIEETLKKQAVTAKMNFKNYNKNNVDLCMRIFLKDSEAQVQIISSNGKVIRDSLGVLEGKKINYPDVKKALKGAVGVYIGKMPYTNEKLMAVSYPIEFGKNVNRVARLVTSLEEADAAIYKIFSILLLAGIIIIGLFIVLSIFVSNTITAPVKGVTMAAEKMALGKFTEKANKRYDDEIGNLADTLNYMADEILKNDRLKNEFISSISHEIRTPLTSIKGWVITLRTGDLDNKEEIENGLRIIENETERLSDLVEDLLDFSRLIDGRIRLVIDEINILKFIKEILLQMGPRAQRLGVDLNLQVSEEITKEFKIQGDESRLKQVFINIIDNAFKFTKQGGKIDLRADIEGENIIFVIEDTGIGISKEHLEKITQKFYKVDAKSSGSGIGLAVCDEIIKLHKGTLQIESETGEGTSVKVEMPLRNH